MTRRAFLKCLSALPLLGWARPEAAPEVIALAPKEPWISQGPYEWIGISDRIYSIAPLDWTNAWSGGSDWHIGPVVSPADFFAQERAAS